MKRAFILLMLSILLAGFAYSAEITVPGGVLNALNDAVQAADSGDVLLLTAGLIYPNQGSIDVDKDIIIRGLGSIEGGDLPYIKELPAADGSYGSQTIQVLNTFKIYNVFFNGYQGEETNTNNARCFRVNTPIDTLIVDGCVFEQYTKRTIALNKATDYFECTNNIFNHNWKISGLDEGRAIDCRNGGHGTIIIENCTFVNTSDRHLRHQRWGQNKAPEINKWIINQCTFLNSGNYRPTFSFWSVRDLTFTNNIVVNPALFGTDTVTNRKAELPYLEDSDAVTTPGPFEVCPFVLTEVDSFNTTVTMSNNNIYQESAVTAKFDASQKVSMPQLFNNEMLTVIDENTAYYQEVLTFNNAPEAPMGMIEEFVAKADTVAEGTQLAPTYDYPKMDYRDLDLGYSGSSQSATAATDGGQLGDRRWNVPVAAVNEHLQTPVEFDLSQNYPNPFNPTTTISYNVGGLAQVKLMVYDILGKKVKTLVNETQSAGTKHVQWDGTNESEMTMASGVYYYKLKVNDVSKTMKMLLMK